MTKKTQQPKHSIYIELSAVLLNIPYRKKRQVLVLFVSIRY